jgi:UDP:flavonoid glycosyltransferase YjiC (YdhE family)
VHIATTRVADLSDQRHDPSDGLMRTVLVVGRPSAPDPSDLAPLLRVLADRGLRVVLLATEDHRALADEIGVVFRLLPPVPRRPSRAGRVSRFDTVRDALRSLFLDPIAVHWPVVLQVVDEEQVDVVLADALCTAACMLADRPREDRPPVVVLGTIPPPHAHPRAAPYGLGLPPAESLLNEVRNALLHVFSRHVLVRPVLQEVRERFQAVTGLEMARDTYAAAAKAEVWAQCETERFEYPSSDPANIQLVGPLTATRSPLPDWFDPGDDRPVVMVRATAGVPLADLVVPAVAAFAGTDLRVIVTGTSSALLREAMGGDPGEHVQVAHSLPASQVLPGTAVVVMTGYFVHALHALQQGTPVVGTGAGAEEAETGARLEWHGCGVHVATERPTASELRTAVDRVIADPGYRRAAARIAAQTAAVRSETVIADLIEDMTGDGALPDPLGSDSQVDGSAPPPLRQPASRRTIDR